MKTSRSVLRQLACCHFTRQAETYPSGPVKFITPIAAGSGTDPSAECLLSG